MKNTNFEWGNNQIFLTQWKIVFWVTDHFCIKWTFKKNAIFCPKNAFFGQTCQFDPLCRPVPACSQGHNFRGVYFYLIPEGFIGGRWRRWWNPPLIIFNLARSGPFLEDLKKKVSKSDWNHIHKVYVTQIHHNTWFLTPFLLKMPKLMLKKGFLFVSKIHIFVCFLGFWRLNWYSKTSFMI